MPKVTIILGGGDWADASATPLILKKGVSIEKEQQEYRIWYEQQYYPSLKAGTKIKYLTLEEWLVEEGLARKPTVDEVEIFEPF